MQGEPNNQALLAPAFVEKLYDEAMALVHEAADYLGGVGAAERDALPEMLRAIYTGESLRVTTRLLQVIAWLMSLRAAAAGEITLEEALSAKRKLDGREVCLGGDIPYLDKMPEFLRFLLSRSLNIYQRAERLEQQLTSPAPPPNPLDNLMRRLQG